MFVAATATTMATLSTARAERPRTADHVRLGVFLGKWSVAGDMAASALSPGGHFSGVHNGAWDFGGYFLVMRYSGTDNGRPVSQIDFYGWDADSKRYTYDSFNSLGQRASSLAPSRETPGLCRRRGRGAARRCAFAWCSTSPRREP